MDGDQRQPGQHDQPGLRRRGRSRLQDRALDEIDGITAANGTASYTWNTAGLAPATYYVSGYLLDSASKQPVFSYLGSQVTFTGFALTGPTSGTFAAGQNVTIQWLSGDVVAGHSTTVSLAYSTVPTPGLHAADWIEIDAVTTADGAGSYHWNTAGVAPGTYYISGYSYDHTTGPAVYSYLAQVPIVITSAPSFLLTGPSANDLFRRAERDDPMVDHPHGRK